MKIWKPRKLNVEYYNQFVENNYNKFLAYLLANRNYSYEFIDRLFYKTVKENIDIYKPLNGSYGIATKIYHHLLNSSNIAVYADYDMDGITSGYVMTSILRKICTAIGSNAKVFLQLPERKDGYGLSMNFCKDMVSKGCNLVITVDNGITKVSEVDYLKNNNVDVVITDHHEPQEYIGIPDCLICNPCYNDTKRSYLAGVAVAFNVAYTVSKIANVDIILDEYITMVALGTIADMMPTSEENVSYMYHGLKLMNDSSNVFLKALKSNITKFPVNYTNVAFDIAPLFNAAGRMGNCVYAGNCLFANSDKNINQYIEKLVQFNNERKVLSNKAIEEIKVDDENGVVVFNASNYPIGLHGLIANKIIEIYNRPAYVYKERDENYIGSMRSNDVNLTPILKAMLNRNIILDTGGHAYACSVTIDKNMEKNFKKSFDEFYVEALKESLSDSASEEILCDGVLDLSQVNASILLVLDGFPFTKNDIPMFACRAIVSDLYPTRTNPNNYWVTLSSAVDNSISIKSWQRGFNRYVMEGIDIGSTIDVLYSVKRNFMYKDKYTPSIEILDIHTTSQ